MSYNSPLVGGNTTLNDVTSTDRGVYAIHPAATVKYGQTGAEKSLTEDVARLYIELSDKGLKEAILRSISEYDQGVKLLAQTLVGSPDEVLYGYIDFIVERIDTSFDEKVQLHEVLTDNYVAYFFGQKPPVFRVSGHLLDTRQDDWSAAFYRLYNSVLRGTRMADLKQVVHMRWNNRFTTGVMLNLQESFDSNMQMATTFQFSLLVKSYTPELEQGRLPTLTTRKNALASYTDKSLRVGSSIVAATPGTTTPHFVTVIS